MLRMMDSILVSIINLNRSTDPHILHQFLEVLILRPLGTHKGHPYRYRVGWALPTIYISGIIYFKNNCTYLLILFWREGRILELLG
jgi:hypothetical protein